ncbi:MAG TPA: AsmA family protein, partial [Xanthobacteraceae bacterium]|nr:AsmA family protein [Xanthobacteraceae bacterium]
MIAAIGIRRLGLAAATLAGTAFAALVILSLLIPADTVRDSVKAEIRAVTGLDPVLRGEVAVSLFPTGTVVFDRVELGDNRTGEPALTVDQLVVRLRFFPLLIGRIEIADVSLVRPTITIAFTPDGRSNWSSHVEMLARALQPNRGQGANQSPDRVASFSEIRIGDGKVILRDQARKFTETLSNVEFALAWPSISKTFAAAGRFIWHDEVIEGAFSLSDFVAALVGDRSGLKIRFAAAPVKFAFDGYISHSPTLRMEGTLAADGPSLRDTLRWAAHRTPPGGGFGPFSLKAQANVVGSNASLSAVNVELDGNVGEGALTFMADGRQTVQGTLAADGLDLTPYVSAIRLLTTGDRSWERVPISLDGLNDVDVDLRLSAARVTLANAKLGRTAVATNLRGGRFTVTVGESEAFGGVVKGSFGLAQSPGGAELKAQLQFAEVDLDQALGELFGIRRVEGKGNLGFAVDSRGKSVYGLTQALNGSANLVSRKGVIAGLNVEQLLKRLAKSPLSRGNELSSGKTPYNLLAANLKIEQGTIKVDDVHIEGPSLRLALAGSASIPARDLDLTGTASLLSTSASGAAEAAPAFELPFVVQGAWDDPL